MAIASDSDNRDPAFRFDIPDSVGMAKLAIAVVDPLREQGKNLTDLLSGARTGITHNVPGYLPTIEDARWLCEQSFDMIFVGMDANPREALRTIENICAISQATIVAYAERVDQELLLRAMRAGAREFLTVPFVQSELTQAIGRAAGRIQASPVPLKTAGKILVFVGAKGGAGVTTIASNFAVALAQETDKNTLLVDMDLPLGDAALGFGLTCEFSALDALRESERLDADFLSRLLARHSSGVLLLAAPGHFPHVPVENAAADRLITVACNNYDYVVIDAGSRLDWTRTQLFELASRIYLVTQVGIPELRNANRMITGCIPAYGAKLEVVVNRYDPRTLGVDDSAIEMALTRPPQWRIPNDYQAVRRMQSHAEPLALDNSPIALVIRQMAADVSGIPQETKKKGLLSFLR